jgi:hypothetical protein
MIGIKTFRAVASQQQQQWWSGCGLRHILAGPKA